MSPSATWTQQNTGRRLEPADHRVRWVDVAELTTAVDRRCRLMYLTGLSLARPTWVGRDPVATLRSSIEGLLDVSGGGLGSGNPESMEWLWPVDDADLGKRLVAASPSAGEVNLFAKLNGTTDWTDPGLDGGDAVRAVHVNELRQAVEWLCRGRWTLPIYWPAGLFSLLPDTCWLRDTVALDSGGEIRSVGYSTLRAPGGGLEDVTVLSGSAIEITAGESCGVAVHRCKRAVDFDTDLPTWNEHDPSAAGSWATAGGLGLADAADIGTLSLTADVAGSLSGSTVAAQLQAMVDGAEQNLLLRKTNLSYGTVDIAGRVLAEFELDTPPN